MIDFESSAGEERAHFSEEAGRDPECDIKAICLTKCTEVDADELRQLA